MTDKLPDASFWNFRELSKIEIRLVLRYPKLRYVKRNNTILFDNGYEVDLDRIQGQHVWHFADWVCHLEDKAWMTDEMLGQFVRLVKDATIDRHGKDLRDVWRRK